MMETRAPWWRRWLANPRKLIAYSLLWGAAFGTWGAINLTIAAPGAVLRWPNVVIYGTVLLFYTTAGWAGLALVRDDPRGLTAAIIAQLPQLIQFHNARLNYVLLCGVYGNVSFTTAGDVDWQVGWQSVFSFRLGTTGLTTGVGINIVGLIVLRYLWKLRHSRRQLSSEGAA
jgi:hypothetical protein